VIETYHASHGYFCLPDMLWKSRLGLLIESDPTLRNSLWTASAAKSAKKAHQNFVTIAAMLLSLEILASSFAGWSELFPASEKGPRRREAKRSGFAANGVLCLSTQVFKRTREIEPPPIPSR
jgi:hypothetical protein